MYLDKVLLDVLELKLKIHVCYDWKVSGQHNFDKFLVDYTFHHHVHMCQTLASDWLVLDTWDYTCTCNFNI